MAAIWEQKGAVRGSIMEELKRRFEQMTRGQLETFATDMASYTCSHMTLSELKSWDSKLARWAANQLARRDDAQGI